MSGRRRPAFNQDDPTVVAGESRRKGVAPAAVVRGVPLLWDVVSEGEELLGATELIESPLSASELFDSPPGPGPAAPRRNFGGGTALMPAAFSAERQAAFAAAHEHAAHSATVAAHLQSGVLRRAAPHGPTGSQAAQHGAPQTAENPQQPVLSYLGLSRFELTFALSAAVIVGITAALLFLYLT